MEKVTELEVGLQWRITQEPAKGFMLPSPAVLLMVAPFRSGNIYIYFHMFIQIHQKKNIGLLFFFFGLGWSSTVCYPYAPFEVWVFDIVTFFFNVEVIFVVKRWRLLWPICTSVGLIRKSWRGLRALLELKMLSHR